jgi:hypothetical protein
VPVIVLPRHNVELAVALVAKHEANKAVPNVGAHEDRAVIIDRAEALTPCKRGVGELVMLCLQYVCHTNYNKHEWD